MKLRSLAPRSVIMAEIIVCCDSDGETMEAEESIHETICSEICQEAHSCCPSTGAI